MSIEEDVMSEEAFNELIDNFEVVEKITMFGRKSIKYYVKKMQAEREQDKKRIQELEKEKQRYKIAFNQQVEVLKDTVKKLNDSISKQSIIDAISVHQDYLLNQATTSNPTLDACFRDRERYAIQVLQELLGEEK